MSRSEERFRAILEELSRVAADLRIRWLKDKVFSAEIRRGQLRSLEREASTNYEPRVALPVAVVLVEEDAAGNQVAGWNAASAAIPDIRLLDARSGLVKQLVAAFSVPNLKLLRELSTAISNYVTRNAVPNLDGSIQVIRDIYAKETDEARVVANDAIVAMVDYLFTVKRVEDAVATLDFFKSVDIATPLTVATIAELRMGVHQPQIADQMVKNTDELEALLEIRDVGSLVEDARNGGANGFAHRIFVASFSDRDTTTEDLAVAIRDAINDWQGLDPDDPKLEGARMFVVDAVIAVDDEQWKDIFKDLVKPEFHQDEPEDIGFLAELHSRRSQARKTLLLETGPIDEINVSEAFDDFCVALAELSKTPSPASE